MESVLTLTSVSVRYPRWELKPLSASLPSGCTALVGTNGAGKTALLRAIVGLQSTTTGNVRVGDVPTSDRRQRSNLRSVIGFLPQNPTFPRFVTAEEAVHFAAALKGVPRQRRQDAVLRALAGTDLSEQAPSLASQLSGGQQRRLALAQAMVHEPALLILDEPTAGLDPVQRREFKSWLTEYCTTHSVLVSTHLVEDVDDVARHLIVLNDGNCVYEGSVDRLREQFPLRGLSDALWSLFESTGR